MMSTLTGIVKYINPRNGLCAIELDSNVYTIFQASTDEIAVNDVLSGNLESLGEETLYNKTQQLYITGCIENFSCSKNQLDGQLRLG